MKKLTLIISALALLIGMSQCTKQRPEMPQYSGSVGGRIIQNVTVNTTRGDNGGDSKVSYVSLDKELKLQWDVNDVIYVYDGNSMCGTLSFKDYVGEDHSKATFTGTISPLEGSKLRFYLFNNVAEADVPGFGGNDVILSRDYATQDAKQITDIISGLVLRSDEIDIRPDGKYDGVVMKVPYAVVRVRFENFGSGDITVRGMSSTGFSIAKTGVLTMNETTSAKLTAPGTADFFTVLMPITSSHYAFGNTVGYAKDVNPWTLNENTYYTQEGSATGDAVVITGRTSGNTPKSVTTTVGCNSESIYAMGGTVTLADDADQEVEYGLVYSQSESVSVPEIGKTGCTTVVGGTESFPAGKTTSFTVDITGLTTDVTYNVRAYAIGENGNVVYAPNSSEGIKQVKGGDGPKAIPSNWNGDPLNPVQGASPKEFSVSATTKVRFSQGNLQYVGNATTPYWKFAEHQFDFLGTTTGQGSSDQNKVRDLFGWGTSGWNNGNHFYQPYDTDNETYGWNVGRGYGPTDRSEYNFNLTGDYAKSDWGVYNTINAGGTPTTGWRTLTNDEWVYLFNTRTNAANLYGHGKVGSCTPGMIILPDEWTWTGDVASFQSSWVSGNSDWSNVYSYTDWSKMESAGAVFLPAAGSRGGTNVGLGGDNGYYWSSSNGSYNGAYCLYFISNNFFQQDGARSPGYSVRLVH